MTSNSDANDPKAPPQRVDDEATTRTLRKPPIVPKTGTWDPTKTLGEADFYVDGSHVKEPEAVSPSAATSLVPPIIEESQSDKTQVHHMDISLSDFQDEAPREEDAYERFDTGPFESLSVEDDDVVEATEPQGANLAEPPSDFPIRATPSSTTFPKPKAAVPQPVIAPLPERSPGASRIHNDPPIQGGLTNAANAWKVVPTEWGEEGPPAKEKEPPKDALPSNLRSVKTALWSRPSGEENELEETQRSVVPDFPEPVPEALPTPSAKTHSTPTPRSATVALASTTYILDAIEFLESIDVSGLPAEPQLSAKSNIAGAIGKLKRALDLLQRN